MNVLDLQRARVLYAEGSRSGSRHGERRSLEAAPRHHFGAGEASELETLLRFVLENAWDATALPALRGTATDRRVVASHDEWIDVRSREFVEFRVAAG